MISKWKLELLAFLTSLTLISVGFSSWQITSGPVMESLNGSILASPVHEYLKFDTAQGTEGVSIFDYNEQGFVSRNSAGTPTNYANTGSITLYYKINVVDCHDVNSWIFQDVKTNHGENATLNFIKIDISISLLDSSDTNHIGSFLNLVDVSIENKPALNAMGKTPITLTFNENYLIEHSTTTTNNVITSSVISVVLPLSEDTGYSKEDPFDTVSITFDYTLKKEKSFSAVNDLLKNKEFSFRTAVTGYKTIWD